MAIHHNQSTHSLLVEKFVRELRQASELGEVLDLACGSGRNGLYLARQGISVVFADQNQEQLNQIEDIIQAEQLSARTWLVDLETGSPLADKCFGAVIVFRYLHRPLFQAIKTSTASSGLVIYETFNQGQKVYGRPRNPDFLLRENELQEEFEGWKILHQFEGITSAPQSSISQIVACR
ncbi:methyltransferase domain-containing protein [Photobacterium sp. SDRW27]|uniref:methyltransferase domain-containing protein n=1 Tax=Photobacterium obscurum TaxID=2829490 RepID=UPI002242CF2C|nr:methyltransferase domain-containing protein [Photobacterium obscurum]MCW8327668.1 methyltransferase domain-containing protein [Photobacterium obscurum]